ncbi:hypothetical protein F4859DRAFT_139132 [Xylaria cf. heliscus]|nr:hypothetical protein F4859DRAFT_139132 [Xylaria cf. heliscus]
MVLTGFSISETGAAETRSIPEWSTNHFEATGRPLRIAIEQTNWWYRNITAEKEAEIKTKCTGSHPREKRIMERILYLLRMNVQLLFVFDGPNKPPKKWLTEHRYTDSNLRLLKELLDQLGVPRHEAPGESAAECARLQEVGIVDAIWTENTDIFMFGGSPTLVQFHRKPEGDQFLNSSTVVVSSAAKMGERANLTREWFLMYATLVGCGYTDGLAGFGAARFFRLAQHASFQAAANLLMAAVETPLLLSKWRIVVRNMMAATFSEEGDVAPPELPTTTTFPDLKALQGCARPAVSSDEHLRDLPCLRNGWFRPYGPDMVGRYRFLLSNFNSRIHESWIARDLVPIELNHRLREAAAGSEGQAATRKLFSIETKRKRKETPSSMVTVDPLKVIPELLSAFPSKMYRIVAGVRVRLETPAFRPEDMELLDCVLRRAIAKPDVSKASPARITQTQIRAQTPTKTPIQINIASTRQAPSPPPKKKASKNIQPKTAIPTPAPTPTPRSTPTPTQTQTQTIITKQHHSTPEPPRPPKPTPTILPPLDTHLPVPPPYNPDIIYSPSYTCLGAELTLPGDLDWDMGPVTSVAPVVDRRASEQLPKKKASSGLAPSPVARRASEQLAVKHSGPEFRRRGSALTPPLTPPLPIIRQPFWDHSAVVDCLELD